MYLAICTIEAITSQMYLAICTLEAINSHLYLAIFTLEAITSLLLYLAREKRVMASRCSSRKRKMPV